jgi:hypothetical protein
MFVIFGLINLLNHFVLFIGRSVISVLSVIPYSLFSQWSETTTKKRGDEYEAFKQEIGQNIVDQVVRAFPKLKVIMAPLNFIIKHLKNLLLFSNTDFCRITSTTLALELR